MGKIGSEDAFFEAQSQDLPAIDFFSHHIWCWGFLIVQRETRTDSRIWSGSAPTLRGDMDLVQQVTDHSLLFKPVLLLVWMQVASVGHFFLCCLSQWDQWMFCVVSECICSWDKFQRFHQHCKEQLNWNSRTQKFNKSKFCEN
jgi:hypothetical protein